MSQQTRLTVNDEQEAFLEENYSGSYPEKVSAAIEDARLYRELVRGAFGEEGD